MALYGNMFTFMNGGGVSAFTPTSLFANGENGSYFNFTDSLVYQESAASTPATENDLIGHITDLSGNDNSWLQATSGDRPTLKIDANS